LVVCEVALCSAARWRTKNAVKSFQRKDGGTDGVGRNFHGEEWKNETHASKTDADAQLYRK
jgi:hypothetical protein